MDMVNPLRMNAYRRLIINYDPMSDELDGVSFYEILISRGEFNIVLSGDYDLLLNSMITNSCPQIRCQSMISNCLGF